MKTIWKWKVWLIPLLILLIGLLFSPAQAGYSAKLNSIDNMAENIAIATFQDDAAYTPATSGLLVIGAEADDAATDSVNEGDAGALRMSLDRRLLVNSNITDIVPGVAATSLGKAEDAAHTSADTGVMALAVRNDSPIASLCGATGEYTPLQVDDDGDLYTVDSVANALLATMDVDTGNIATSVAAIPSKGTAAMAGSTPVTIATDDTILLALKNALAPVTPANLVRAAINVTSGAGVETAIIAADATNSIYIVQLYVATDTQTDITVITDTVTSHTALTGDIPCAQMGGIGPAPLTLGSLKGTAAKNIGLKSSAAADLDGFVVYYIAP